MLTCYAFQLGFFLRQEHRTIRILAETWLDVRSQAEQILSAIIDVDEGETIRRVELTTTDNTRYDCAKIELMETGLHAIRWL